MKHSIALVTGFPSSGLGYAAAERQPGASGTLPRIDNRAQQARVRRAAAQLAGLKPSPVFYAA